MLFSLLLLGLYTFKPIGPSASATTPEKEAVFTALSFQHVLSSKHSFLDTVELEDESAWMVAPPDVYKVVAWEIGDTVVLTPNSSFFSIYQFPYYLTNITRQSYVRVKLTSHPCSYKPKSRWVTSLNTFGQRLFLNDGSSWKIHPDDADLFQNWSVNDFVIYGCNDQLLTSYPFLLINVRLHQSIRAVEF